MVAGSCLGECHVFFESWAYAACKDLFLFITDRHPVSELVLHFASAPIINIVEDSEVVYVCRSEGIADHVPTA